jgi:hypothetical protein
MKLTAQQAYELLEKHGVYATEACDKCGKILGAVRYTRKGEVGEWCSSKCRGDLEQRVMRKGGRPRKYQTEAERVRAKRLQSRDRQRAFRVRVSA